VPRPAQVPTARRFRVHGDQSVKDLMRRLGHASPVASYRYLHAVDGRDAEIAAALSDLAAHGDAAKLPKSIVVKH
jgi:hypothetical protein